MKPIFKRTCLGSFILCTGFLYGMEGPENCCGDPIDEIVLNYTGPVACQCEHYLSFYAAMFDDDGHVLQENSFVYKDGCEGKIVVLGDMKEGSFCMHEFDTGYEGDFLCTVGNNPLSIEYCLSYYGCEDPPEWHLTTKNVTVNIPTKAASKRHQDIASCTGYVYDDPRETKETNGCTLPGQDTWQVWKFRGCQATFPLSINVSSACNAHDICWMTCPAVQSVCDDNFYNDLENIIYDELDGVPDECFESALKEARRYQWAVSLMTRYFRSTQSKYCMCCSY